MPRKKKDEIEDSKLNGTFNVKAFAEALLEINQTQSLDMASVKDMLKESLLKAYKEWWCTRNGFSKDNAASLLADIDIDWDKGTIALYDCKQVLNEDDITDDFYQISLEDAQKIQPDIKVGDVLKTKVDPGILDTLFIRRTVADFHQKMKEKARQILLDYYANQLGHNILGSITRTDDKFYYYLDFGKSGGTLSKKECLPKETFRMGEQVKVYLKGVGDRDGRASLVVSRTDEGFVKALFEEEIPEVADGTVKIVKVARQAGVRSKIMVASTNPHVDPVGAILGQDSVRYKAAINQLNGETVDVLPYAHDPDLLLIEALRPAKIIGISKNPNAPEDPWIAICPNNDKRIAVGRAGSNVRLASRIVGHEIQIMEIDPAIKAHVASADNPNYLTTEAIRTRITEAAAKAKAEAEAQAKAAETPVETPAEAEPIPAETPAQKATAVEPEAKPVETPAPALEAKPEAEAKAPHVEEAKPVEAEKPVEQPAKETEQPVKEEQPTMDKSATPAKQAQPKPEAPVEHVAITGRAKVSLDVLEKEIEKERERKGTKPSWSRFKKSKPKDLKKEEEKPALEPTKPAMPIYTPEELKEMDEEEAQNDQNNADDIDYDEEYDNDKYYDDDDKSSRK